MPEQLLLVIDADVTNRVAAELKARGRAAKATSELELHRMQDEPLLRALADELGSTATWLLVSGDDAMPDAHGELLSELRITLATIDPRSPDDLNTNAWRRDVIHRWAHAMGVQEAGTIRRYSLQRHGLWRPRRSGRRR